MGAFLEKPKTEKTSDGGAGNGLRYGLSSMQGWRVEMEDAHEAVTGLPGNLAKWSFFAVFDGHAGARVSECCAQQLLEAIVATGELRSVQPECAPPLEAVKKGIRDGFLNLDERMRAMPEVESGEDRSGSTAVSVLVSPQHFFFGNCGDSRAVLVRDQSVAFATQDHKPVNPIEKERIQNAGGSVMIQRVNGSLAVSRALGDYEYKNVEGKGPTEQLVSPEPEINIVDRDPVKDEFMVLACDGIWDVMTNEELALFVHHRLQVHEDLKHICNEVIDTCLYKGSRDNMSIVIVCFDAAPVVNPETKAKECQLDKEIEKQVIDICDSNPHVDLNQVYSSLNSLEFDNLPPGGGLASKQTKIEEIWKKVQNSLDSNGTDKRS